MSDLVGSIFFNEGKSKRYKQDHLGILKTQSIGEDKFNSLSMLETRRLDLSSLGTIMCMVDAVIPGQ